MKVNKNLPLTVDRLARSSTTPTGPTRANLDADPRGDRSQELRPQGGQSEPKATEDTRTPEELLDLIEAKGREVDSAIAWRRLLLNDSGSNGP